MDRAAIGDQIDRILHSRSFAGKSQLAKLLEVLFHHMDSQTTVKTDRVIKELWPEEIKTKRSADVATEMNRLRKALECYYNTDGATDPVVISLPNRSVATPDGLKEKRWIVAEPRAADQKASPQLAPLANPHRRLKFISAIAAIAAIGLVAYLLFRMFTVIDQPQSCLLYTSPSPRDGLL